MCTGGGSLGIEYSVRYCNIIYNLYDQSLCYAHLRNCIIGVKYLTCLDECKSSQKYNGNVL